MRLLPKTDKRMRERDMERWAGEEKEGVITKERKRGRMIDIGVYT